MVIVDVAVGLVLLVVLAAVCLLMGGLMNVILSWAGKEDGPLEYLRVGMFTVAALGVAWALGALVRAAGR